MWKSIIQLCYCHSMPDVRHLDYVIKTQSSRGCLQKCLPLLIFGTIAVLGKFCQWLPTSVLWTFSSYMCTSECYSVNRINNRKVGIFSLCLFFLSIGGKAYGERMEMLAKKLADINEVCVIDPCKFEGLAPDPEYTMIWSLHVHERLVPGSMSSYAQALKKNLCWCSHAA
jgi:hypothetical protein